MIISSVGMIPSSRLMIYLVIDYLVPSGMKGKMHIG